MHIKLLIYAHHYLKLVKFQRTKMKIGLTPLERKALLWLVRLNSLSLVPCCLLANKFYASTQLIQRSHVLVCNTPDKRTYHVKNKR